VPARLKGLELANVIYTVYLKCMPAFDIRLPACGLANGQYLGTIKVGRQPANAAFVGPDKRMLYITAREALYRIPTLVTGADRLGK
jgi:hypothetical protein